MKGFTLVEVLIVIAIVAILAAIAFPSYESQIQKSRRADAQAALSALEQEMVRFKTLKNTYENSANASGEPLIYHTQIPSDGAVKFYNLRITAADVNSYMLEAQPIGPMAGTGTLSLSSTGLKRWDRDNSGSFDATENCWNLSC